MPFFLIAIDGPAASGKSSVSRRLAARLNCACVNSGSLYRAATWGVLQAGVDPADPEAVAAAVSGLRLDSETVDGSLQIRVNGLNPEEYLRDPVVAASVSKVASVPVVREILTGILRSLGSGCSLIMEGRDIGTVVFPGTPFKFYIDASETVRLQRRQAQGEADSLVSRDRQDSTRKAAPLRIAEDAKVIDSTHLGLEEVVSQVVDHLRHQGLSVPE
ncbi:MAG: (d)CMP kinase [Verrucomicrobiaceae bacterium]|nr:MAG: (d)CMP kinase [Verrucomicrobiaceae bacterium]